MYYSYAGARVEAEGEIQRLYWRAAIGSPEERALDPI